MTGIVRRPVEHHPVLYTDAASFPPSAELQAYARDLRLDLRVVTGHDPAAMLNVGRDCVGVLLIHGRVGAEELAAAPSWRVLARVGTGYDNIDVQAAMERGVTVTNVPNFATEELSCQVMLFVLAFARGLPHLLHLRREGAWVDVDGMPPLERLSGQSLGLIGFGASARATATKAQAFGMRVAAWSRTSRPDVSRALGVTEVGLGEALACDYVSVHVPETPATTGLIGERAFSLMRPGSVLVNIARGRVVDTQALLRALRSGRLRGAGLDVTDPEPLPATHPLWGEPNVILTMHTAAVSRAAQRSAFESALADVARVLRGEPPLHPVPA